MMFLLFCLLFVLIRYVLLIVFLLRIVSMVEEWLFVWI